MSFSGAAGVSPVPGIESFVYPNTGTAEVASSPPQGQIPQAPQPRATSEVPRISEAELKRLLSEARAEGLREGEQRVRAAFEEELAQQRKLVTDALSGFEQERAAYFSRVEIELVHIALAVAARILHRESQTDPMVVAGLVKVMLQKLQQGTKVKARVPADAASKWRHYFQDNENLEVVEDASLGPKDCKLETELGIADLGLDAQLKEVEQGFLDLIAQKPQPK
jgi:flagellar assembly protein FliH